MTGRSFSSVSSTGNIRSGPALAFSSGRNDAVNGFSTIGATNRPPTIHGTNASHDRLDRRQQEHHHAVAAHEIAVADAAAAPGVRRRDDEDEALGERGAEHQPLPARPPAWRRQQRQHREDAREEVAGQPGVAADEEVVEVVQAGWT